MHEFVTDAADLRRLLLGMRAAYARGENVMAWARQNLGYDANRAVAILVAYDLQTGAYVERARSDPEANAQWVAQLAGLLDPYMMPGVSLLEVGCGEATTLNGVIQQFGDIAIHALGFDISWSRIAQGQAWLHEHATSARLFVGDLFDIPLEDNSIDVVYTSHSIEPNGGRELEAMRELLRVARRAVVLVEPLYELADEHARHRMEQHGYVRGLRECADRLSARVVDYQLLPYTTNPLNPSGVLTLVKDRDVPIQGGTPAWQCPLTHTPLVELPDLMFSPEAGVAYPILRRVPLLRAQHAVVATWIENGQD